MSDNKNIHQGHRQRLKNRFLSEGLDHFGDVNMLELLLFYCVQRKDTNPLAHRLLDHFGKLADVLDAPFEELIKVEGVTENIATYLLLIKEAGRYYQVSRSSDSVILPTLTDCGKYLVSYFYGKKRETMYLLCLDAKCKVICCKQLGEGSVNSVSISVRKIVETAINANATSVILAHNHPSGIAVPSLEDIQTTKHLAMALRAVDITLADHMVISDDDFVSMIHSGSYTVEALPDYV